MLGSPLLFEVFPTSQKVALGEPIRLTFRVRNVGTQDALANRRFYLNHVVWLKITAPSGQEAAWCDTRVNDAAILDSDYVILRPRAHVERTLRVSCNDKRTSGFSFVAPGEYVVRAHYRLGYPAEGLREAARGAFILPGKLEAKPVHIEVLGAQQ
jgi:hypothetical protein